MTLSRSSSENSLDKKPAAKRPNFNNNSPVRTPATGETIPLTLSELQVPPTLAGVLQIDGVKSNIIGHLGLEDTCKLRSLSKEFCKDIKENVAEASENKIRLITHEDLVFAFASECGEDFVKSLNTLKRRPVKLKNLTSVINKAKVKTLKKIAKYPQLPPEVAFNLVNKKSSSVRKSLAENPNLSQAALRQLANRIGRHNLHSERHVLSNLAGNPNLPEDLMCQFVRKEGVEFYITVKSLSENPKLSLKAAEILIDKLYSSEYLFNPNELNLSHRLGNCALHNLKNNKNLGDDFQRIIPIICDIKKLLNNLSENSKESEIYNNAKISLNKILTQDDLPQSAMRILAKYPALYSQLKHNSNPDVQGFLRANQV